MGKAARIRHRAQRRAVLHPDDEVGIQVAWCRTEDDLVQARKAVHDQLIKVMGDRRSGPVSWRSWTGQAAVDAMGRIKQGATRAQLDGYRRISAHLREWGGYVVMATAPGKRAR